MDTYRHGDLVFDVIDEGPADGPVVVLLHGFPQFNTSWGPVIPELTAAGYRCLAPNQRGYSPGARPAGRRAYRMSNLIADTAALIDASGAERIHLVGYDWGAAVAWGVAGQLPQRLASLTTLSVPHPAAFLKSLVTSRQLLASWYMFFFQLPAVPELAVLGRGGNAARMTKVMRRGGQRPDAAARDAKAMVDAGALTAALNWYRAMPFSATREISEKITVPTMYVYSDNDIALLSSGARACGNYVSAEYRFETLPGVSHWMVDEKPEVVTDLLLEWFGAHPI